MTGPTPAEILRAPFPEDQIGKLPKIYCTPCARSDAKVCTNPQHTKVRCEICKGTITSAHLHLDYVGHAAVTDRLLKADPSWSWEPLAFDENGLPRLDAHGGLWIRLTVNDVTRLGYGDAQGKTGNNAIKEAIGDCLLAGTPILTRDGIVPIEDVRIGQEVPTRNGWRRVTDHWLSAESAPVLAVLTDDARVLVATPHHRVPTARGVSSVRDLRKGDILYAWRDSGRQAPPKTWSGTAALTDATPSIRSGIGAPTTWLRQRLARTCTAMSTWLRTERYLTGSTSTTSITIPTTTHRRTWPALARPSTLRITSPSESRSRTGASVVATISSRSSRLTTFAGAAPDASRLPDMQLVSSSRESAQQNPQSSAIATSAAVGSVPPKPGVDSVGPRVVAVLSAGEGQVWNLSVEDVHEYVANGIFVHNSIRNAAMRFGVALDLWSKEDLTPHEHDDGVVPMTAAAAPRTRGRRAEAPAAEPATDAAPAGDGKTELAQTLADTAAMVKTTTLLRGVHTTAKEKSLLTVEIVVPVTGEVMALSKYIADRKVEIERPEQPRPIERAPVPEPENGTHASQPDVDPVSQEAALASFYDAAKRAGLSKSEADNKFCVETGRGVLEADPAALLAFIHAGAA